MNRRRFLIGLSALSATPLLYSAGVWAMDKPIKIEKIIMSDAEWRERLTEEQFHILREEGTEPPGSSVLNDEKRSGIFQCAGCELPLFDSEMKYDSGTGWPRRASCCVWAASRASSSCTAMS